MKKSELTQLTQIIEVLVTKEIRKQLPKLIGEVFANMAGRSMIVGESARKDYVGKEVEPPTPKADPQEFRASLKELFTGATPVTKTLLEEGVHPQAPPTRNLAKDPVLNEILNQTMPLRQYEKLKGMGMYAATAGASIPSLAMTGVGEMMPEADMPAFARGQPPMIAAPQGQPQAPIREGHVPLSDIPDGISALDVARAGLTPPAITAELTNYDRMKKILEASKGRRS